MTHEFENVQEFWFHQMMGNKEIDYESFAILDDELLLSKLQDFYELISTRWSPLPTNLW